MSVFEARGFLLKAIGISEGMSAYVLNIANRRFNRIGTLIEYVKSVFKNEIREKEI